MIRLLTSSLLGMLFLAPSVSAQEDAVSDFLSCDPLVIPSERLACFDSVLKQYKLKYGLLEGSAQSLARENRQHTRAVPQGRVEAERLNSRQTDRAIGKNQSSDKGAHATILAVKKTFTGYRTFTLDDGSQWQETDGSTFPDGDFQSREARVEEGFLGSWRLYIDGITGFARVKRIP